MIKPVEIWVLYWSCGCVRWRNNLSSDDHVKCEHADAYVYAEERRIVDGR